MPWVTYLNDNERKSSTTVPSNSELDSLLADVRKLTGEDWLIRTWEFEHRVGWFKKETVRLYALLVSVGSEYQVMTLMEGSGYNSATSVGNFLIGYICAITEMKKYAQATDRHLN